eukprot:5679965-Lingulodinium_polyedra.AAC.1
MRAAGEEAPPPAEDASPTRRVDSVPAAMPGQEPERPWRSGRPSPSLRVPFGRARRASRGRGPSREEGREG